MTRYVGGWGLDDVHTPGNGEKGPLGFWDPRSPSNGSRDLSLRSPDQRSPLLPHPSPETGPYTGSHRTRPARRLFTHRPHRGRLGPRDLLAHRRKGRQAGGRFCTSLVGTLCPESVSLTVRHDKGPLYRHWTTRYRDSTIPRVDLDIRPDRLDPSGVPGENFQGKST